VPEPGRVHRLFGRAVTSDFPFIATLPADDGAADLVIAVADPPLRPPPGAQPAYTSRHLDWRGAPTLRLYHEDERDLFRFASGADFGVETGRIEVALDGADRALAEIHLLGAVISVALEREGLPVLHAAVVGRYGRAIAFLGRNRAGKSSLAVALIEAGWDLLTDDVLAVELRDDDVRALPSYPQLRLWKGGLPPALRDQRLSSVHPRIEKVRVPIGGGAFGSFAAAPLPLARLMLLEPDANGSRRVRLEHIAPRDAVTELVRYSAVGHLLHAAALHATRLPALARIAAAVPMCRVRYTIGAPVSGLVKAVLAEVVA
jgi:hypothetical protein